MKAQELKQNYPLYPEIKISEENDGFLGETLVRIKREGKYYLHPIKVKHTNKASAESMIKEAAELVMKHAKIASPDSYVATQGYFVQPLDDNQED